MISVEGLVRLDSPSRGPPFVPSRITRVDLLPWPKLIGGSRACETANPVAAVKNCLRVNDIVQLSEFVESVANDVCIQL